jgi:hypothetical protein
LVDFEEEG